jgi:S-adenosylmethionine:tRNA ribosyltransferase-isomerase
MRLEDFDYELPGERIAQTPIEPRSAARLLVDQGSDAQPAHRIVADLPHVLEPGDVLVVNDSKVFPARLRLRRQSGGAVEVLLLEPHDPGRRRWEAIVRPGRKLRPGEVVVTEAGEPLVRIGSRTEAGDTVEVEILGDDDPLALLGRCGEMPLPPYITTPLADPHRYQTVYATDPGSAAAPTAGLHFTTDLLGALRDRGVTIARVELVVGLDTFKPVTESDPTRHRIHSERYRVPDGTIEACAAARSVVAVGTTSARALESAADMGRREGRTTLFIHGAYEWRVVDRLMTNFHMPRTTLLMMIDAFVGRRWRRLYETALAEHYRFLSFGDAMLLDRRLP